MRGYAALSEYLGTKTERPAPGRKGNTRIVRYDKDCILVVYHNTAIVRLYSNGWVKLNSGGWRTSTTKQRMNEYLPVWAQVYQKDYAWYVRIYSMDVVFEDNAMITVTGA